MSPIDAILLIPIGFGLLAALGFYVFARSIHRRQISAQNQLLASKEVAPAPFEQDATVIAQAIAGMKIYPSLSLRDVMKEFSVKLGRASKIKPATEILTKTSIVSSARPKKAAREKA